MINVEQYLKQHPTNAYSKDIAMICDPLTQLNISSFTHVRLYPNHEICLLSNDPIFFELYIKKNHFNADLHTAKKITVDQFFIWDLFEYFGQTLQLKTDVESLGILHLFTTVEKNKKWTDYYHFGTTEKSNTFNQVYFSNLDLLNLFIQHYQYHLRHSKVLAKIFDYRIVLENDADFEIKMDNNLFIFSEESRENFINNLAVINFENVSTKILPTVRLIPKPLCPSVSIKKFSRREVECMYLTVRGKSAKQISEELKISRRTVEEYIANIKDKMGVFSKADLIDGAISLFDKR